MKKILKILLIILLAVILLLGGLTAFLTITEFKPDEKEVLEPYGATEKENIDEGDAISLLTYNIGYGGQSADMDLVAQGGESVKAASESLVNKNLDAMRQIMKIENADILLLQQVDIKSTRSYNVDEVAYLESLFPGNATYAMNYSCKFIPLPLSSPMGSVKSGLLTINKFPMKEASRDALVAGYSWPTKLFEPKNCLSVQRVALGTAEKPAEGELVIINLTFDSKDDGAVKIEQTKELATFMKDEYAKGNYVIAGGTFNQTFPGADNLKYPVRNTGYFMPGIVEETLFGEGWTFAYDESTPTARLMNQPYSEYDPYMQLYVIDGFITSPNVTVTKCYTIDTEFKYSSHNPVRIDAYLGTPKAQPVVAEPQYDENGNVITPAAVEAPAAVPNTYVSEVKIGEGVLSTTGEEIYGTN
ncbi:MAG: endonuclease [Firmicutes bacterium]|nr:endonuclease [Bacillota bacterium]